VGRALKYIKGPKLFVPNVGSMGIGWSRNRIFLFREIRNNNESDFNFAKFPEISFYFISQNFVKCRKISYKIFREIVSLCKFFKYQYILRNFAKFIQDFAKCRINNYFAKLLSRYVAHCST
jgi:hypothetical protein